MIINDPASNSFIRFLKNCFKVLFIAWLLCLSVSQAHSQVIIALLFGDKLNSDKLEFGLARGLNFSHISNIADTKNRSGFNLGLFLNIKLDDNFFLRVEAVPKFPTGVSEMKRYSLNEPGLDSLLNEGH